MLRYEPGRLSGKGVRGASGEGTRAFAAVGSSTTRRSRKPRRVVVTASTSPHQAANLLTPPPAARCRPGAGSRPR